ncbi:unnamed protein product [Rangifer tarandus platyrhynchus]|uniref:Uncharacterized protein n=1 Tax=Rangifer tarandus platyrhynchus TaxID=3082113 RepID=A0ABN8ZCJ4_RANTA|nr:unnamed protein product [Rangifer tarandus platyrhynchus]
MEVERKNSDSGSEPLSGLCHDWLLPRTASKTLWPCSLLGQKAASENRDRVHGPVLPQWNVTTSFCSLQCALDVFPGLTDSSVLLLTGREARKGCGRPSWRGGCPEMPDAPLPGPSSSQTTVLGTESERAWSCSCSGGLAGPRACSSHRHGEPPAHGLELVMIVQTGKWTGWKSESELNLQS